MENELRELARRLLEERSVEVVLGYGKSRDQRTRRPLFVTRPEEADELVFDPLCFSNLVAYLNKRYPTLPAEWAKAAVVVKGCDAKAALGLFQESQLERERLVLIGVSCDGMEGEPWKCKVCDVHRPRFADHVLGGAAEEPLRTEYEPSPEAAALEEKSREERFAFWREQFSKCIRCYACRAVCPLCACTRCIADSNQPQWVPTSGHEAGNWSWNLIRAMHLAGRCIGCGECARVCPTGIPLDLLNQHLRRVTSEHFGYISGQNPDQPPPLVSFTLADGEEFIR